MSAEQPYTDEAMKVWNAAYQAWDNCVTQEYDAGDQAAASVITAAMAEKNAEIARLREAVQGLLDMPGNLDTDCNPPEAQQLVLAARLKAWANARQRPQTRKPRS
jgi:hypothetical protein